MPEPQFERPNAYPSKEEQKQVKLQLEDIHTRADVRRYIDQLQEQVDSEISQLRAMLEEIDEEKEDTGEAEKPSEAKVA